MRFCVVRLMDFELKYWGQNILMKLVGLILKFIKIDRVIVMKEFFSYAGVMVEMSIEEEFFEVFIFQNEWGAICYVLLKYEQKFIKCNKCGMYGYEEDVCKKG